MSNTPVRSVSRQVPTWAGLAPGLGAAIATAIAVALAIALPLESEVLRGVAIAAGLILALWAVISRHPEFVLVVLVLHLGLLDGFVRLRTGDSNTTLLRDLLLYGLAIGVLARHAIAKETWRLPPLFGWVALWIGLVLVQVVNPHNGTVGHSLASLRPHLEFVPLFFLCYALVRTRRRLRVFLLLLLAVAALNGIVGQIQFSLTPEELSDWGPGYRERIEGTGDVSNRVFVDKGGEVRVRPPGLGADMGFAGSVGVLAAPAVVALLGLVRRRRLAAALALLCSAAVVVGIVTSQSRTAVVSSVLVLVIFGVLATTLRRLVPVLLGLAAVGAVAFFLTTSLTSSADQGLFDRYESIAPSRVVETTYEYRRSTLALVSTYVSEYPLGAGLGTVGPATAFPGRGPAPLLNAESEVNYLVIEVGLLGALLFIGFHLRLILGGVRRLRRVTDLELRLLLAALLAPLTAMFLTGVVGIYSAGTPGSPYLWATAGVLAGWLWRQPAGEKASYAREG